MKLNLGCGSQKLEGWVNVDSAASLMPDQVVDLERTPWPWSDNVAEEILLSHVLEHLGPTPREFLAIMTELWRVSAPSARITVIVPHPRHDSFLNDPTHVRPITPEGLLLFDRRRNLEWAEQGVGNTPLGLILGIDLTIVELEHFLDDPWLSRAQAGEISRTELIEAEKRYNNVISQTRVVLEARKT
ncbi:class I SAM-dependent methyltransferase [Rhodospirillum sp. A1_3_36]|uniref:class I SAM-dependent methyltransferase n=1 Tax=Rhodospirillum sp. A1_3_36 TaxID=3391666 RepID=UPI0039A42891